MNSTWKRQMVVVWVSQMLSIMGFSFALPFAPYFIQEELGITQNGELQLWVALFSSSTAVTMAVAAPLWGMLADRFGKRVMLLRANLGGAVVMSLIGGVESPVVLIVLRAIQGGLSGTMTAAQAFLSGEMPKEHRGLAMGGLSAAVYSGMMGGAFLGGFVAHWMGYRAAFAASGGLLLVAGLLVLLGTKETGAGAVPKRGRADGTTATGGGGVVLRRAVWGVLAVFGAVSFVRQFDISFLPLLVQDIHGVLDSRVALWSGWLNACGSVAGLVAGLATGWLSDRIQPLRVLSVAAAFAAVFSGWQMWIHSFDVLFPVRFFTVFFAGALEPALNAWLSQRVPPERQGVVFGLASTARSAGWAVGPLLAGWVATVNLRGVFGCSGAGYLLLAVAFAVGLRFLGKNGKRAV